MIYHKHLNSSPCTSNVSIHVFTYCSFCIHHIFIQSSDSASASLLFLLLACVGRGSWYEENINKAFKQYSKKCQFTHSTGRYIINHILIQQISSAYTKWFSTFMIKVSFSPLPQIVSLIHLLE